MIAQGSPPFHDLHIKKESVTFINLVDGPCNFFSLKINSWYHKINERFCKFAWELIIIGFQTPLVEVKLTRIHIAQLIDVAPIGLVLILEWDGW